MKDLTSDLTPFLSKTEIQKIIRGLARQIENDYEGQEVLFICPLRGSIHFVADLIREVNLPQRVDFVYLQSASKGGSVKIIKDISENVNGKDVLILEEVIDSGRTLQFLVQRILASQPNSLKIVTLLDKPARRDLPIQADYVGRTIDDRYVVGYGMDSDELGRNFPDIYSLKN